MLIPAKLTYFFYDILNDTNLSKFDLLPFFLYFDAQQQNGWWQIRYFNQKIRTDKHRTWRTGIP